MASSILSNEDIARMQAELDDPNAELTLFSAYLNQQHDDLVEERIATEQEMEDLITSVFDNGQNRSDEVIEEADHRMELELELPVQDVIVQHHIIDPATDYSAIIGNIQEQNADVTGIIMNNGIQLEGEQVWMEIVSPNDVAV